MGEKAANIIFSLVMVAAGFGLAFTVAPVLALITLGYAPILAGVIGGLGAVSRKFQSAKLTQMELLSAHTEETLGAIKLVASFAREDLAVKRYDDICEVTRKLSLAAAKMQGGLTGLFLMGMFGFFLYIYFCASILL